VMAQNIAADVVINSGSSMTVTLSKGAAVTMIDFTKYTPMAAQDWAKENAIVLTTAEKFSSTVAEGISISQSVYRGTFVEQQSKITVIYSLGNKLLLSDFAGKLLVDLQDYIASQNALGASIALNISYQTSDKVSLNHIIAQSKYDVEIAYNASLDVIVSTGKLIKIPDFSLLAGVDANTTYLTIIKKCEDDGIVCRVSQQTTSDLTLIGKVLSQSVAADQLISADTIIDVVVGK
jgi:beta-lactam-binding protein with PASTA domain